MFKVVSVWSDLSEVDEGTFDTLKEAQDQASSIPESRLGEQVWEYPIQGKARIKKFFSQPVLELVTYKVESL